MRQRRGGVVRAVLDWWLRDRRTGRWVIGQFPNIQLGIFLAAMVIGWLADGDSTVGRVSWLVATLALAWWAGAEMWSGVNPFRRVLGVIAAVVVVIRLVHGW